MYCGGDIVGEFVKWRKKAKKLSKAGCDGDSNHCIPNKESNDRMLGDSAFFPSDSGMREVGNDGSNSGSNKIGEPNEVVVLDDEIGQNSKKGVVEGSNQYAYYEITKSVFGCFDVF